MATITVDLVAKTGVFSTDIKRAARDMQRTAQQMEADLKRIGTAFGAIGVGAALGLGALVKQSINAADAMNDMSKRTGLSVEMLSRLQVAAKLSDTSLQALQTGVGKLAKAQTDAARGGKEQVDVFNAMGVAFKNADGSLRDTESLLLDVADVFATLPDGAEKTALALKLLGRGGQELLPFLSEGSAGIREMNAQADALGITLSQNTTTAAAEFNDKLDLGVLAVQGLGQSITAELIGPLDALLGSLVEVTTKGDLASQVAGQIQAEISGIGSTIRQTQNDLELFSAFWDKLKATVALDSAAFDDAVQRMEQAQANAADPTFGFGGVTFVDPAELLAEDRARAQDDAVAATVALTTATDRQSLSYEELRRNLAGYLTDQTAATGADKTAAKAQREREQALKEIRAQIEQNAAAQREFGRTLTMWAAELSGPVAQAQAQYEAQLSDLDDKLADGTITLEQYYEALQLVEKGYDATRAAAEDQEDVLGRIGADYQTQIRLLGMSTEARRVEEAVIRALAAEQGNLSHLIGDERVQREAAIRATVEHGEAQLRMVEIAAQAAREYEGIWENAAQSMGEYLVSGAENGLDGVMDLMAGFARDLQSFWVKNAITIPLQQQMQGGGGGMAGFGQALNTNSMYGQGGTGSTAGGWMSAAGSAFGGWEAAQEGNALGTVAGFTAAGAQIGGVYGAIVGAIVGVLVAVFKDVKPPDLRIGAEGYTRKPERAFDTAFGSMQVGVRGGVDENPFIEAVTQFDETLASVIRTFQDGDAQFEEVRQRLATWSLDLRGMDNISAEAVLESRFGAILGTFDQDIQAYVRGVEGLEAQVQRLSDAAFIQAASIQGDLLPSFTELATILETNRAEGEAITAVYERLRGAAVTLTAAMNYSGVEIERVGADFIQFAADAVTAAGGLDRFRSLVDSYFQTFYTEAERNARNLDIARVTGAGEFADIGLNLSDYTGDGGAAAFRTAFETIMGSLSAEALVEWYEAAQALGIVLDLQQQVNGALTEAAEALTFNLEAAQAYAETVQGINRQLYELSGATEFRQSLASIQEQYLSNVEALQSQARAAGLLEARTEDVTAAMQLQARQVAALVRELEQSALSQADALGLTPLSMINSEIAALQESEAAAAAEAERLADSIRRVGQISSDVASAMLGDFSPLSGQAKADYALRALQEGAIGLDAALNAGRDVFASGADFNQFFQRAVGIAQNRPQESANSGGTGGVSVAMRQLLERQTQLQEEAARAAQSMQARDLASTIADLSFARGEDFQTVIESLGIDLDTFLSQLGFADDTQLGALITQLQDEQNALAAWFETNLTAGESEIVYWLQRLYEEAGRDPLIGEPAPTPEQPYEKDPWSTDGAKSAAEMQEEQTAENRMLRESVDLLRAQMTALMRELLTAEQKQATSLDTIAQQEAVRRVDEAGRTPRSSRMAVKA